MKKLLVVLSLAMSAFSFQASAATVALDASGFGAFHASHTTGGSWADSWTITFPSTSDIAAGAQNTWARISGQIANFTLSLDGIVVDTTPVLNGKSQLLSVFLPNAPGSIAHTLVVSGTSNGSYTGSFQVAQTPIPAAVWLFGSALMGLTGVSRRKKA
jgi:hypothetical protein